jgi:hypothetical protein
MIHHDHRKHLDSRPVDRIRDKYRWIKEHENDNSSEDL